jgi:hypothetical protein
MRSVDMRRRLENMALPIITTHKWYVLVHLKVVTMYSTWLYTCRVN